MLICGIGYLYILFVYYTSSWKKDIPEESAKLMESGQKYIFVFWHNRLLMVPPFSPKKTKISVVISEHKDGEWIASVMKFFGYGLIRGSSSRNAAAALKEIIKTLKRNEVVSITPDGPRGPRMKLGGNVIKIAQMADCAIIPVTYSVSKCKILNSWDRFIIAKPFSKGAVLYGKPINIKRKFNDEQLKKAGSELENSLNNISKEADMFVGVEPILPDNT